MSPARNRTQPSGSRRAAGKTRAAARKNQKNSQPKPGGQHVATGPGSYALLTTMALMSGCPQSARLPVAESAQRARMPVLIILVYAAAVYLFFLAVLGYAAGFFAGFGVPKGIDQGPRATVPAAVAIDLLLLLLFAVQHTVMARPWFKRRWTRIVPEPAERASFVLAASLVLALLFWLWRPVGATVWSLPGPGTGLYGRIRHPLMAGFMVIFWSAPVITAGHLLFAAAAARYILADIAFEEHD